MNHNNAEILYASYLADKAEKEWLFAESKYRKLHDMAVDMYNGMTTDTIHRKNNKLYDVII